MRFASFQEKRELNFSPGKTELFHEKKRINISVRLDGSNQYSLKGSFPNSLCIAYTPRDVFTSLHNHCHHICPSCCHLLPEILQ